MEVLIVLWILFIVGAVVYSYLTARRGKDKNKDKKDEPNAAQLAKGQKELVEKTLAELNCEVKWADEEGETCAYYEYQGGHFKIMIDNRSPYVRLNYLFCFSEKLDKLTIARIVVNKCNINSENIRLVYSINKEQNELDIHIISEMMLHPDNAKFLLKRNMAASFVWQNTLTRQFADVEQQSKAAAEEDTEKAMAEMGREIALMKKQENAKNGKLSKLDADNEIMTVKSFISSALGLDGFAPTRMMVQTNGQNTTTENADEILHFIIDNALPQDGNGAAHAFIWGTLPEQPSTERVITMAFCSEGARGNGRLFRVTATLVPLTDSTQANNNETRERLLTCSVLMGNDSRLMPISKEAEYMWKEAVQKTKNEQADDLTPQQKFVAKCYDQEVAVRLYNGKKLFLDERYYEALLFFEEAFHIMQQQFDNMQKNQRDIFFYTIYHIGFCYGALGQYTKAMAYLDMVTPLHKIPFAMEMINCMVNSGDFRAENAIDTLTASIKEGMMLDEDEKPAPHLMEFLAFLARRKTAVLINKGKYAEAKVLLKKMLNDPYNADFAIDELAQMQRLEKGEN